MVWKKKKKRKKEESMSRLLLSPYEVWTLNIATYEWFLNLKPFSPRDIWLHLTNICHAKRYSKINPSLGCILNIMYSSNCGNFSLNIFWKYILTTTKRVPLSNIPHDVSSLWKPESAEKAQSNFEECAATQLKQRGYELVSQPLLCVQKTYLSMCILIGQKLII